MKHTITLLFIAFLLSFSVFAADVARLYACDIRQEQTEDSARIYKIYELSPADRPEDIPTVPFEQDGFSYVFADLLKEENEQTDSKTITEPVTVNSKSKNTDAILKLLPPTKAVTTEDGFSGTLTLDTASIRTEASGYGSSSKTITATRSYPNLADADMQHIPKTITEGGRTLTFASVQWQTNNTRNVDDTEIGDRYTAIATYTGTKTNQYVKGYTVTAAYKGNVSKTYIGKVRYTAVFVGTPIPVPLHWLYFVLLLFGLMVGAAGMQYSRIRKKRKERELYAMFENYLRSRDAGGSDDIPRLGAGIQL